MFRIHCFKKRRKTFSQARRCPSGRMRGGEKCSTPALTHRLRRSPLSRRAGVILWMMDSATPPCGFAQNDGIAGDIQVSYRNEGSLQSFTCEAVSTHLTLTVCEEHDDRAEKYVIESFPSSCAGLRVAFKSLAREGRDTRRLQRAGSSCRRSRRMRERDDWHHRGGAREICFPICLSIFATSCESLMKALIRIGCPHFSFNKDRFGRFGPRTCLWLRSNEYEIPKIFTRP